MADYRVILGVEFDKSDLGKIKTELNNMHQQKKINLEFNKKSINHQINAIKKQIQDLSNIKIDIGGNSKGGINNSISISAANMTPIIQSFNDLKDAVVDIRNVLGTIDDTSDMKTLISSIRQISDSLGKASDESQNLVSSLSALSKKDFGFNFNLKAGNSSPIKAMTDYGRTARNETIPALQEQVRYLESLFGGYGKLEKARSNYFAFKYKQSGPSEQNNLLDKISGKGKDWTKQMDALNQYIEILEEIATKQKVLNLDEYSSKFSKSAKEMVDNTVNIQSGAKETEETLNKLEGTLKRSFGSGIDSESFTKILDDLKHIRESLEALSSNKSLESLTQSFVKLSNVVDKLTKSISAFKQNFNTGLSDSLDIGKTIENEVKVASSLTNSGEQVGEKIGDAIESGIKKSFNIDDVIETEIDKLAEKYYIEDTDREKLRKAFKNDKLNDNDYTSSNIDNMVDAILGDGDTSLLKEANDEYLDVYRKLYEEAKDKKNVNTIKATDVDGNEITKKIITRGENGTIYISPDIVNDIGHENINKVLSRLGRAKYNTSLSGMKFDSFVQGLNDEFSNIIDTSNIQASFRDFYGKFRLGQKGYLDEFDKYIFNAAQKQESKSEQKGYSTAQYNEVANDIYDAINRINQAKNQFQQSSSESSNIASQELEKYQNTLNRIEEINKQIDSSNELYKLSMEDLEIGHKNGTYSDDDYYNIAQQATEFHQLQLDELEEEKTKLQSYLSTVKNVYDQQAQASKESANAVKQDEDKKQDAYNTTTETVMYHAGIVSKLNKSETNGRFYGSNRGTGYFGTGYYFVDAAHKNELDNDSNYNKLPYTSVDISQYDNLFKVTSDEIGYQLHNFLGNLTQFTQGSDNYDLSELFAQFKKVFGDTIMDAKEFGDRLDQLKTFMTNSSMDDRSDSVSTQFMKSLGYGGVDTRGTSLADTRYGTVIYDLKEESVLQANITNELQKQGQMLEKINYENGQVFDKNEDLRIQGILDEQAKIKEINNEFEKSFDSTNYNKAETDLNNASKRLKDIERIIYDCQNGINNATEDAKNFAKEMKILGVDMSDKEIEDQARNSSAEYQSRIDELTKEKVELESKIPILEEVYNKEGQLYNQAYEQAKQVVEARHQEVQATQETADANQNAANSINQTTQAMQHAANASQQSTQQIQSAFKQIGDIEIDVPANKLKDVEQQMNSFGFDKTNIQNFKDEIESMFVTVKNIETYFDNDGTFKLTVSGIDEFGNAVTAIKGYKLQWDKELKDYKFVDIDSTKITKSFNEVDNAFEKLVSKSKEISNLKIELAGLDDNKNANRITEIIIQLNRLEKEYKDIFDEFGKSFDSDQFEKLNQITQTTTDRINKLQAAMRDTSATKKTKEDLQDLIKTAKQIGNLELNIEKLKFSGGKENEIKSLEDDLHSVQETYDRLVNNFNLNNPILVAGDLTKINDEFAKTEQRLERLKAQYQDTRAELAKEIELKVGSTGKYTDEVDKINTRFNNLSKQSDKTKISIDRLNDALIDMKNASNDDDRIEAEIRYQAALQDTKFYLERNEQAQRDAISAARLSQDRTNLSLTMDNWLKDNSAAAKEFGGEIKKLQIELKTCDNVRLGGIKSEFKEIQKSAQLAGKTTKTLGDRLKTQFQKYSAYLSVAELFMYAEQGLRDMFEQVKLIDSAMTELKKVTDETDATYNKFLSNAAERAKVIGTTIDGLVDSTAEFAKIGYSFEDSQGLAEVANIYTVVGDNIESAEVATESLISTMAAFKDEMNGMGNTDFAMSIVDKFNEVSNKYSIGSGGLGEALTRSASSMAAANNTLDETIALITAAM